MEILFMDKVLDSVNHLIQKYGEAIVLQMDKRIDETADKILEYIKANCPRSDSGSNHLADSFIKTKIGDTTYISSKTKGKLVHLIELGYKHTSGKFVRGRPFLIPGYDRFTPKMIEDLKGIIQNGTSK
jgi:hypothetical protein